MERIDVIKQFPAHPLDVISKETIEDLCTRILEVTPFEKAVGEQYRYIRREIAKVPQHINWDDSGEVAERKVRSDYYEDVMSWVRRYVFPLYIKENGYVHTSEEACTIAADKLTDLIFVDNKIKDNGALYENGGILVSMMSCLHRERIRSEMQADTPERFREAVVDYFKAAAYNDREANKRILSISKEFYIGRSELSADYDPDHNLKILLEYAGVKPDCTSEICPWKTAVSIDTRDNAVRYCTYQNIEYI